MDRRLQLHQRLVDIATSEGLTSGQVYFQPPSNLEMKFPCIVYNRDSADTVFAGNLPYRRTKRYEVTIIDRDPDSSLPDKVAALPQCTFSRAFAVENLNHDVFNLYF